MGNYEATNYIEIYKQKIASGEIVIGDKIRQALDRHDNDLQRDDLVFNTAEPNRVIQFIELMDDPKTKKPLKLALFQKVIITLIYGWRWKETNLRRFQKAYISMARKNGKSILVSGIALYEMTMSRTKATGRQVFLCANSAAQASLLLGMMKEFVEQVCKKSPFFRKNMKVVRNEIRFNKDNSYARIVSSDTSKLDGFEASVAIIDRICRP